MLGYGCSSPELEVANVKFNCEKIVEVIKRAHESNVQILSFPELSITGYTCADLFLQETLLNSAIDGLEYIINETKSIPIVSIVGMPIRKCSQLFNCAVVIKSGKILGIVPKTYIPNYNEFYEARWFSSGKSDGIINDINILGNTKVPFGTNILFEESEKHEICFGIEICEDLWTPEPPSVAQALNGANIIFNLSSSNEIVGKYDYRKELIKNMSARLFCSYVYASSGLGESSTDLVFGGQTLISENGKVLEEGKRYQLDSTLIYTDIDIKHLQNERYRNKSFMQSTQTRSFIKVPFEINNIDCKFERQYDKYPFVPSNSDKRNEVCQEIFNIQSSSLVKRLKATGIKKAVIGISGGLDSTLAFLVTNKAFQKLQIDPKNIIAVTMPGFGTTNQTYQNSINLIKYYGATLLEIDIKQACINHLKDILHDINIHDETYENAQARERMQILMDLANKENALVVGTGDLSELALGFTTYNGDHMSMYGVNCSIPKTLVKHLIKWISDNENEEKSELLNNILELPISPELLPPDENGDIKQKTEDLIGPYELHDFFLYYFVRCSMEPKKILYIAKNTFDNQYSEDEIKKWLKVFINRFFKSQFKRSCLPDGPKVGSVSLSPRGDFRMPSDASVKEWIDNLGK